MKAVYINLDPYLAAFAAWLKGGKSGPAPSGPSVPLSVTIPPGERAAIYCPGHRGDPASFVVDGVKMAAIGDGQWDTESGEIIAENVAPGLSAYPGTEDFPQVYALKPVEPGSIVFGVLYGDAETGTDWTLNIPVVVYREAPQGPIDVIDFTPPASAIAAGTDLNGATFDGKEIYVNSETGSLVVDI